MHFEFCKLLGAEWYTFHDRDVAPEGRSAAESAELLHEVGEKLLAKQKQASSSARSRVLAGLARTCRWVWSGRASAMRHMCGGIVGMGPDLLLGALNPTSRHSYSM